MHVREQVSYQYQLCHRGYALLAIPVALILVITVADMLTPSQLSPLLVTAPAVTASFAGPRLTGGVSAITVFVQVLLDAYDRALGSQTVQTQLIALMVVSAFLVIFSVLRDKHQQVLTRVRSVSEAAQRALLRPLPSRLGPIRLASTYLPADEEAQIGGDLYAAARMNSGTRLVIGDVRGKGLSSVSDVALLLGAFREAARRDTTLPDVAVHLDDSVRADVEEHAERFGHSHDQMDDQMVENFITAAVMEISDHSPTIELIDCGHPPPLLIRDHHVTSLQVPSPAPPLGLGELSDVGYDVETFDFRVGDTILLYTDGVIEARGPSGAFYPLAERVSSWPGDGPETLVAFVRDDLLEYVGGRLGDDAAMVAIQRLQE